MFLSYFTLFVALSLSAVAAWYSIIGLTAIFAAAVVPIIIMGGILEVAKITITVWLHEYWHRCRWLMKVYLVPAVALLMIITSMGIFGFLSKAHLDQAVPTGDVQAQVALLDEKISTQRDNIETARTALKQMDSQVNELLTRSVDDRGAERAVQIRRQQARERSALQADIAKSQAEIAALNQQRAPVAAELRKVEAEVGPIKYIAALIYGDDPDANILEKAVRWVIILLVVVFDPLAIMMVLAASESLKWRRETPVEPAYPSDDGPLTDDQLDQIQATAPEPVYDPDTANTSIAEIEPAVPEPVLPEKSLAEQHPYVNKGFAHFKNLKPMPAPLPAVTEWEDAAVTESAEPADNKVDTDDYEETQFDSDDIKEAKRQWKIHNPDQTLKEQRQLLADGKIDRLPWLGYLGKSSEVRGFGSAFPKDPVKGDFSLRTDVVPTKLFKFNGEKWIEVDKDTTDVYAYDDAYIAWLIQQIDTGSYDVDLLTESEREQIAVRLNYISK
jgi:hypothetical protein